MLAEKEIRDTKEEFGGTKEWTLMFYFASDNPLAISIVSQLKAIKAAGFHHEANVIVQFDPYTEGTPTHIFDVNAVNKVRQKEPNIGFDGEPFVPTLIEDRLWRDEQSENGEKIRDAIERILRERHNLHYRARTAPELNGNGDSPPADQNATSKTVDTTGTTTATTKEAATATKGTATAGTKGVATVETTLGANFATQMGTTNGGSKDGKGERRRRRKRQELDPRKSLEEFLKFCRENYKARHYMLFILGHGVVVGNDIFLYDEHADQQHSISLNEMGDVLTSFREELDKVEATFELVSFHSCSVSSLEVAYQLKNTANYFLASQGPQFVGSYPYRAILMRIFKDLMTEPTSGDIRNTIREIFNYCFRNSDDFLLAGYSYQLTLCDLRNIDSLNEKLQNLSNALYDAMFKEDPDSTSIVLYSHWKAQGFFQEMYTDLYDFCFCIMERCEQISTKRPLSDPLAAIWKACIELTEIRQKPADANDPLNETAFVLAADFAGPAYQYSRGMSVYFPWSRPSVDSDIMEQYGDYTFHTQFHAETTAKGGGRKSWRDFLDEYFEATQRVPRGTELLWELPNAQKAVKLGRNPSKNDEQLLDEDIRTLIYNGEGPLGGSLAKDDPRDRTGEECSCASFKNYPRDTRPRKQRKTIATPVKKPKSAGAAQSA